MNSDGSLDTSFGRKAISDEAKEVASAERQADAYRVFHLSRVSGGFQVTQFYEAGRYQEYLPDSLRYNLMWAPSGLFVRALRFTAGGKPDGSFAQGGLFTTVTMTLAPNEKGFVARTPRQVLDLPNGKMLLLQEGWAEHLGTPRRALLTLFEQSI